MKIFIFVLSSALFFSAGLAEKNKTLELRTATTASQKIEISGLSGSNIKFNSWTNNEVYIKLYVSISSSDDDYEVHYINNVKISQKQIDGVLRLELEEVKSSEGWGSSFWNIFKRFYVRKDISGDIYVPQSNALSTDMRYGSLTLDNMKGDIELLGTSNTLKLTNCTSIKEIDNNYGKTWITNSGGALRLTGTSSTVNVRDFTGSLNIDADYSTVTVEQVSKSVTVSDKSGKIFIDKIHGDATLDADYSSITINNVDGFADIRSTSGSIAARQVTGIQVRANYTNVDIANVPGISGKPVLVRGQSGRLTMTDVVSDVQIENPYSPITLTRIKGNIDMMTTSSTVSADDITGDWHCRSQYSTIDVRGLTAKKIEITNSSNSIRLGLNSVPASIDIKNQYGSVTVNMPAGFSGNVDMNAEYGNITTTLRVKVKTMSSSAYAVGKVGSGNGIINIETKSGNISIEEQ
ncbi:MAG: DUF4097 family beta strand repeat-containing protein [Bacteroidota bacterium]